MNVNKRNFYLAMLLASLFWPGLEGVADETVTNTTVPQQREFATKQTFESGGKEFQYKTLAGEIFLRGDDGEPTASIFSTSYFRDTVEGSSHRPIMFLFNGGPGSTSVWLHLAAFGPKRIDLSRGTLASIAPPFRLEQNLETLLWHSDLVFVDPIGTGYSRSLGDDGDERYWGVDEDANSLAEFIRRYLTQHKRWNALSAQLIFYFSEFPRAVDARHV